MALRIANPQRPRAIQLFANPAPYAQAAAALANPRRRRKGGRRRNPATMPARNPVTGRFLAAKNPRAVAKNPKRNPVVENPRRRRPRFFARRNPSLNKLNNLLFGVGLEEVAGGIAGAFAAQEGPGLIGWDTKVPVQQADGSTVEVASWQQVIATAGAGVGAGVLASFVSRGAAAGAVVVGLVMAGLKGLGNVTGGKFGMVAGSPTMHMVTGAASRQAVVQPANLRAIGGASRPTAVDVVQKTGLA